MLPPALLDYTLSLTPSLSPLSRASSPYHAAPRFFRRHLSHAAAVALKTPAMTQQDAQQSQWKLEDDADLGEGSNKRRNTRSHGLHRANGRGRRNGGTTIKVRRGESSPTSISNVNKNLNADENTNMNALSVELSRRVKELEKVTDKVETTNEYETPTFSEEDLATFYEDVLAHHPAHSANSEIHQSSHTGIAAGTSLESIPIATKTLSEEQYRADLGVLEEVDERLGLGLNLESGLGMGTTGTGTTTTGLLSHRVVNKLGRILEDLERKAESINRATAFNSVSTTTLKSSITPTMDKSANESINLPKLPIPLLSKSEWEALVRAGVYTRDVNVVERAVEMMKRCNLPIAESQLNALLLLYIDSKDVVGFESCLERYSEGSVPTTHQRHLHTTLHLSCTPQHIIPLSALDVLHVYEARGIPAPMNTYSKVIGRLFGAGLPAQSDENITDTSLSFQRYTSPTLAHAQAWDLFSHMRYVAHPTPDVYLYTQMIRACASPYSPSSSSKGSSDAERALDLWYEMTIEKNLVPTSDSWDAVVLACARAGSGSRGRGSLTKRREYVNEAFRLARQMLDSNRDAYGNPEYVPSKKTFCALLEGAKRVGELGRTRWILAEMVRGSGGVRGFKDDGVEVDEEVMMHVFHAYAAYKPPFRRSLARVVESRDDVGKDRAKVVDLSEPAQVLDRSDSGVDRFGLDSSSSANEPSSSTNPMELNETPSKPYPSLNSNSNSNTNKTEPNNEYSTSVASSSSTFSAFSHVPPQTSAEVIAEVDILFERILRETRDSSSLPSSSSDAADILSNKFTSVHLTTRLLNSYLSTYYAHGSLEASMRAFNNLFPQQGGGKVGLAMLPLEHEDMTGWGIQPRQSSRLPGALQPRPSARTYVEALERCAMAKKPERELALRFGEGLIGMFEKEFEFGQNEKGIVDPRMIERAHVAWIRVLALTNNLDQAQSHLRTFVARYPPSAVRHPSTAWNHSTTLSISKPAFRSTRTSLVGTRPLVRLTSPVDVVDVVYAGQAAPTMSSFSGQGSQVGKILAEQGGKIPPVLVWRDLEVLHHRIVAFSGSYSSYTKDTTDTRSISGEVSSTDEESSSYTKEQAGKTKESGLSAEQILNHTLERRKELRKRREKDLAYIKWVCKSYEWALRVRRDEAMRVGVQAQPPGQVEGKMTGGIRTSRERK
ncbi:hypothetical protein DFJ43DRAFT_1083633 [Lentinula guzmanii]|uniref:Uncharacterized protein n=1 Tax=Lentinula guzmanii TaxID=2804957 RepID=A0AA38MZ99_9AGAR|nr:hypothetical protein DFJ43DRAFT_1083633 [Lentinula guzmanii]